MRAIIVARVQPTLSYCVVNTNGREYLLACLAAIERTQPAGIETEMLVLDNASSDGSAEAVRALGGDIRADRAASGGRGKAANDSTLLSEARGRYCLLLNEDSELRPGATAALLAALEERSGARRRRAPQLLAPTATPVPCAWRFPGSARRSPARSSCTAGSPCRAAASGRGGSTGRSRARCSCAARRPPRSATSTRDFFVYSDECDFCKRLADAGWHTLFVPAGRGGPPRPALDRPRRRPPAHRRIPPQPRPLHAQAPLGGRRRSRSAASPPGPTRCAPLAATVLPGQPAKVYCAHARQALFPSRGESLRDRAT